MSNAKYFVSMALRCILFMAILVFLIGSGPGTSSADQEEDTKIEGAKREKKLLFYSVIGVADSMMLLNGFKKKHPYVETELYKSQSEKLLNKILMEAKAKKHFADVFLNNDIITHRTGRVLSCQLLAAGEFPIVIVVNAHTIEIMKKDRAPVEWIPMEPVVTDLMPITLAAHAPHPNAAKLFLDYVLSQEGQKILRSFNRIPARTDVHPDPPRLLKGLKLFPSDPELIEKAEEYKMLYNDIFLKGKEH